MHYTRVLVICDNSMLLASFKTIASELGTGQYFRYAQTGSTLPDTEIIDLGSPADVNKILRLYDLVISLHCKQIFPAELLKKVKCINIHPGYNPVNRGWFPQVFAILHSMETGATIHEMTEQIDHGPVIERRSVKIEEWDTSYTAYQKIVNAEVELLRKNLLPILENDYRTFEPEEVGDLHTKQDFADLLYIDKNRNGKFSEFIDLLRALSFKGHRNAYFIGRDGKKIYLNLELIPEEVQHDQNGKIDSPDHTIH